MTSSSSHPNIQLKTFISSLQGRGFHNASPGTSHPVAPGESAAVPSGDIKLTYRQITCYFSPKAPTPPVNSNFLKSQISFKMHHKVHKVALLKMPLFWKRYTRAKIVQRAIREQALYLAFQTDKTGPFSRALKTGHGIGLAKMFHTKLQTVCNL